MDFQLRMPPAEKVSASPPVRYYHQAFCSLALAAGGRVETDPGLRCWGRHHEITVNGKKCLWDYGDFPTLPTQAHAYEGRFIKRIYTPTCHRKVLSGPITSFLAWGEYERLRKARRRPSGMILHRQVIPDYDNPAGQDCRRRRLAAREKLMARYGHQVDCRVYRPQDEYFSDALGCRVSVHIPGAWRHILDRGQAQMMALGVPTISPEIFHRSCGERPEPGVHYLRLRDDYSNLCDLVDWCFQNRLEAERIGQMGAVWFLRCCSPVGVWSYLLENLA